MRSPGPSARSRPTPPVPEEVRAAARAAFTRRDPRSTVADEIASVQSPDHAGRLLCFASPDTRVDVQVRRCVDGLVLLVCVHPRSAVAVRVRHGGPDLITFCRSDGRCRFSPVRPGPVSLVIGRGRGRTATTWTCL